MLAVVAALVVLIWLGLLLAHAGYWRFADRDFGESALDGLEVAGGQPSGEWPEIAVVIPARNEVDVIADSLTSVLGQDYPGRFRVYLVDDQSDDGTGAAARAAAVAAGIGGGRLTIIAGTPRPAGWTGKLWALDRGIAAASSCDYFWLTDADIGHARDSLRRLVVRAVGDGHAMVSVMARLSCVGLAERALIPAFVYFFAMLYLFERVNRRADAMAAAAGGCVLIRSDTLAAAGGIAAIRGAIIDDCALARAVKPHGALWLGLTDRAVSLRPYGFDDIRRMVARSAYAQLGYSPLALIGCLAGLALVFLAPPLLAVFAGGVASIAGIVAWGVMAITLVPILRFYGVSLLWAPLLPGIALVYAGFTFDSAVQHWRGRGGMWKGRAQALQP